jgi:hypothetical protein
MPYGLCFLLSFIGILELLTQNVQRKTCKFLKWKLGALKFWSAVKTNTENVTMASCRVSYCTALALVHTVKYILINLSMMLVI